MAGSTRYMRYILFAFTAIIVLYFISSSTDPASVPGAQRAAELIKEQAWRTKASAPDYSSSETAQEIAEQLKELKKLQAELAEANHESSKETSPNPFSSSTQTSLTGNVAPGERANATFVTLARNSDVWDLSRSIRQVEDRFNHRYNYDWVFLNDDEFDDTFKKVTTALTSGKARYGKIDSDQWGFPDFIDQDKAASVRDYMHAKGVIYGDSISYRHMCRYESGFFFRHEIMQEYEWYWRVEPSIELFCDIAYDPFIFMRDNGKKYSFVLSLYEYIETIPTLWASVKKFMKKFPEHIHSDNSMAFLSDDGGDTYNKCHFWSNFEIGSLKWLRSQQYVDWFDFLDQEGGFFYERWGDAPVHSIAAALMLQKDEIHFFNDIAYYHVPFTHCPTGEEKRIELKCHCDPKNNFDWNGYSCTTRYYELHGLLKPEGWESEKD